MQIHTQYLQNKQVFQYLLFKFHPQKKRTQSAFIIVTSRRYFPLFFCWLPNKHYLKIKFSLQKNKIKTMINLWYFAIVTMATTSFVVYSAIIVEPESQTETMVDDSEPASENFLFTMEQDNVDNTAPSPTPGLPPSDPSHFKPMVIDLRGGNNNTRIIKETVVRERIEKENMDKNDIM